MGSKRTKAVKGVRTAKRLIALGIVICMVLSQGLLVLAKAPKAAGKVINVLDYGADPTGIKDSTVAIQKALKAAKKAEDDGRNQVTLNFPKGEYHIYKDYAEVREYHTSNTNSIEHPEKTIGILIEEHKNLTVEGNGSLFMMHGNMMALAVVKSDNITLRNFSWDFAVPTVSEMTIMDMGMDGGQAYTDFYIPKCFPFEISGSTIKWYSEKSPYTGEYYWTETGIHNAYSIVGYQPDEEMTRAYFTSETPFQNVSSISKISDTVVRITYTGNNRPAMQKAGMVLELASSAVRETAGAFTWESTNVLAEKVNVHFMHGFGWLIQMSKDVTYRECNFMPRKNSGHITVSYADIIHASGAAGQILIEDCNFSNSHDDPINLHGTFTRVENRVDDHNLVLKYIHQQQGGFPQFHVGDKVAFFTRDTLESTDNETLYTVEAVTDPGQDGNDLRTMQVRFKETLPVDLSDRIGSDPKYVAENVTYAPAVTIRNNTFKNVPTRGILCTTRNKVLIENNTFLNMSMATIYLSNDSDQWYESGPIRDMEIRNNTFHIKNIGRTSWEYAPAVYFHPVTKGGGLPSADNPIHKNITIEDNTFHMDVDTVVKAESVENLTIRNNKVWRKNPDVSIQIAEDKNQLAVGEVGAVTTTATGDTNTRPQDNVFEFTKCKNVILEGNTYDDGLKKYAVLSGMPESYLTNKDSDIKVMDNRDGVVTDPVRNIRYASTDPSVVTVDDSGKFYAKKQGTAEVYAYYVWNDTIIKSNAISVTVSADTAVKPSLEITTEKPVILEQPDEQKTITATTSSSSAISWSVSDFLTGGATEVATINESGVVTAKQNGIVWVKASVEGMETEIPVVVSLPTEKVNPAFSIVRESKGNYELNSDSLTINMQSGDLYQSDNNVQNLFLYTLPDSIDKNAMRTIVKVDNLPVRESDQWDTGAFILYEDDNNYITIGKKSHYDGITSVREVGGAAVETGGNSSENSVSTALLGFTKNGDSVSLDFKVGNGEWQKLRDLDASMLGDNYKIGFATWGNDERGTKVTFSDFRAAGSDVSYQDLENQATISWGNVNQAPEVNNLHFSKESYYVGESAEISYDFSDADNDSEGASLYLWNYTQDGVEKQEVTDVPRFTAKASGTLKCEVYPKDAGGAPGYPAQQSISVEKGSVDLTLDSLEINGEELLKDDMSKRSFDVYLPADLTKVELSYHSIMPDEGTIKISVGDKAVTADPQNVGSLVLESLKDKDVISVERGKDVIYKINVHSIESNNVAIKGITMPEIGLDISDFTPGNWLVNTEASGSMINITADASIGKVELQSDHYRKPVPFTKSGEQYSAEVNFRNGLNTYYVVVTAKDNITTKKYIINVIYNANSDVTVQNITLNGSSIDGFDPDVYEYVTELPEDASKLAVAAESDGSLRLAINQDTVIGSELESTSLKNGVNDVYVMALAGDGITRKTYHIKVVKPYKENTNVLGIALNEKDIADKFDDRGKLSTTIPGDKVVMKIQAEDKGADIKVSSGKEVFKGKGSLIQSLNIYKETPAIDIEITARDGKTKKSYYIDLEKAVYLSDLDWKSGATVGYDQIQKDKASSGSVIRIPDKDGNPVTFEKGIGTHAESIISYDVAGLGVNKLQGYVGIDYAKYGSNESSVQFQIFAGDTKLFDSEVMLSTTPMKKFDVDIGNTDMITLKALKGENNWSDHADWADIKLTADFKATPVKYYAQTITPAEHGVITSSVEGNKLLENSSVTYTFTPDKGYFVKEVVVNGQKVMLTGDQYTVDTVTENITVSAEFAKGEEPVKYYSQTITSAENGVITSSTEGDALREHSSVTYTFTPDAGCHIIEASVNGQVVLLEGSQYTVADVMENITVSAVFAKKESQAVIEDVNGTGIKAEIPKELLGDANPTLNITPVGDSEERYKELAASLVGKEDILGAYQVALEGLPEGVDVSAVTLHFPVDSKYNGKRAVVKLLTSDHTIVSWETEIKDGQVTIENPMELATFMVAVDPGKKPEPEKPDPQNPGPQKPDPQKPAPQKPDTPKPDPQKPDTSKPGQTTGKPSAAKTGDASPVAATLIGLMAGGAVIAITVKKKRQI